MLAWEGTFCSYGSDFSPVGGIAKKGGAISAMITPRRGVVIVDSLVLFVSVHFTSDPAHHSRWFRLFTWGEIGERGVSTVHIC